MSVACVILAAGLGTRMKSRLPKVLHKVAAGSTLLECVIASARQMKPDRIIVVAGAHIEQISRAIDSKGIRFALQKEAKGTGHALRCAWQELHDFRGTVIVLNGDTPLVSAATVRRFLQKHHRVRNAVSVLSFNAHDPHGYGRIVRDSEGHVVSIIEEKDAGPAEKAIREVNSGVYAIRHDALFLIDDIRVNPVKGEYYLTDVVGLALRNRLRTDAFCFGREEEFMGVNTREELLRASELLRQRIVQGWIARGVTFLDASSVFIHPAVRMGRETTVYPNVWIDGASVIGRGATIYPNVRISNSWIGDAVTVKDSSVVEDSQIRTGASVGPFAHLRPGSDVGPGAKIGNFVELKKTVVGRGSKASHLSYLGDARIGKDVNIGAGTITCNYDGTAKHITVIDDGVFIGSDTQLVAPVRVGKGAYIGAGSTITKNVAPGALALSRTKQSVLKDWARKRAVRNSRNRAKKHDI